MVATVGSIQVLFDAQYGPAVQSLRKFAAESDKTGKQVGSAVQRIDRASQVANRSIAQLNGSQFRTLTLSALRASNSVERLRGILLSTSSLLGGFTAAFAIRGLQEYSDTYRSLTNQIKVSITEGQSLAKTQEDIFQSAQRSRSEYEATAKLFSRINTSAKKLQIAQKDSLRVTETIQKAFVLGGSTPTEAAQSSLQLSQGIASNRLGGDELRSVLENPALGQLLAKQISGGDIGKLRELSEAGKLTAGVVIRAFLSASQEIDEMFKNTEQTVAQAFQRIDNALLKYVGTNESVQSGMSATVALANALADNIDTVATAIIYLGTAAAGVFGAKKFGELSAYVGRLRDARIEAANAAKALRDSTAATALQASKRLTAAQLSYTSGNIADSKGLEQLNQMRKAEAQRIQLLKDEREAAKNAAGAELQRALAIKDGTQASLVQAQQTAKNKGFIADSEANRAANDQLQTDLKRLVVLKQQRDELEANARVKLEDARADRDAIFARQQALKGDRASEGLTLPGGASVLGNVNKELERSERALTKAQADYNDALKGTAQTENEIYQIRQRADAVSRVQIIENQTDAQKGLSTAYQQHAVASKAAAEAEADYAKALRESNDVARVQAASDRRLDQNATSIRTGAQAQNRKELAEAMKANAVATRTAEVAAAKYSAVLQAQRVAAMATTGAMRALSYTMEFLGGPLGVALVAISGYLAYSAYQAEKAKEVMDRYSGSLEGVAATASSTTQQLRRLGAEQQRVAQARDGGTSQRLAEVDKTQSDLESLTAKLNGYSGAQIRNAGATRTQAIEVMKLRKEFVDGKISFEDFKKELDAMSGINPDFSKAASSIINLARLIEVARGALAGLKDEFATVPAIKGARPGSLEAKKVPIPEDIRKNLADQLTESSTDRLEEKFKSGKLDTLAGRMYGFDTASIKTGGGKKDDPYGDAIKSTKTDTAELIAQAQQLQKFNPLIKDYGKGVAAAKEAQDLLTAAQKGGQAVGKELSDVDQLLYGDLSKLSPAAREQAEAIRGMALSYGDATARVNQLTEANQKATEEMEWQKDVLKSSLSTFRQSLIEGKSLWQALGDVALNVLDKIADKLEQSFVDSLFSSGGGGFNILSLFGLGGTSSVGAKSGAGSFGPSANITAKGIDSIAAKSVGITDAAAQAAASEKGANLKQQPIPIEVRSYFDDNGNFKSQVARISARTTAPMMEKGVKHFAGSALPDTVDNHMAKPRRRRIVAL